MYAQKLFIHDRRKWKRTERVHASLVDLLRVLVLTLQLESKVVCQVPALVVASK